MKLVFGTPHLHQTGAPRRRRVLGGASLAAVVLTLPLAWTGSASLPSAAAVDEPTALVPGQIASLSTETSNTYLESDGTYTAQVFSEPVNYRHDGQWSPIDNSLVSDPKSGYAAVNAENAFDVHLPEDMSQTPLLLKQGASWVSMRMHGVGVASPEVADDTAVYADVARADNVEYQVVADGVKERIELATPPASPLQYTYTIDASAGLTPSLDADVVLFKDPAGVAQFSVPAGVMFDSASDPATSTAVDYSLTPSGSSWTLTVTPDLDWLQSPNRVYPITIDPSLSNQPDVVDCYLGSASPDTSHCGNGTLYIKAGMSGTSKLRGAVTFDVSGIPANSTVNTGSVNVYLDSTQTTNTSLSPDYAFYEAGKTFDTTATWNSAGGNGAWSGGSPGSSAYGTRTMNGATDGYKTFGVATVIQGWVNGSIPNRGLILKQTAESANTSIAFFSASTDAGNNGKRPYMNVNYTAPPSSLTVSPCIGSCDPTWRFTNTLTPTLGALANNGGSGTVNYSWELRRYDDGVTVQTGSSSAQVGQATSWTVPTGILANEHGYEYRVGYVGISGTTWTTWQFLGVDLDEAPATPTNLSLSPCAGTCATLSSTSLMPVLTARLDDPDTSLLSGKFEVRQSGTTAVLASATIDPVAAGDAAEYAVPSGVLANGGSYEFRVGGQDGTSVTWGAWAPFTVALPSGPPEPKNLALTTCDGDCAMWNAPTSTPTFAAARSDSASTATAIKFEVQSGDFSTSGTVSAVAPLGTATWTLPSGSLSAGNYLVRAGAQTSAGTTWTAWHTFVIQSADATNAVGFPNSAMTTEAAVAGDDPHWTPTSTLGEDGPSGAYGNTDLQLLDVKAAQDETDFKNAGYDVNSEDTTLQRKVSIPMKYAPLMWIHPDEPDTPISAITFIDNSVLKWAHDGGCPDHGWTAETATKLGDGDPQHQATDSWCSHTGTSYKTTDEVAPHNDDGGPDGEEGFYLDLSDKWRDGGSDTSGGEPVYYRYEPKNYLTYWFSWGESDVKYMGHFSVGFHEGEWEHIAIKLNSNNNPTYVRYFYHHSSCSRPWSDTPRTNSHPQIWVAKDSHGSYPANSNPETIDTHTDNISGAGRVWYGTKNLQNVMTADWYGYGGGWGENRNLARHSGPEGPSPYKVQGPTVVKRCE